MSNKALDPKRNFININLASGIASTDLEMTLVAGGGAQLPDPSTEGAFNLELYDKSVYYIPKDDPNREIVRVTAIVGNVLTIVRAQEGTADVNHNTGGSTYSVVMSITKKDWDDVETGKFNSMERVVSVAKSGGDFLTIQDALDSISDATFTKRYTILVAPGIYAETVTLKPFIDIVGTSCKWNTTIQQVNATLTAAELQICQMKNFEIQTLVCNFQNAGFVKALTLLCCYVSVALTGVGQNNTSTGHIIQFMNSTIVAAAPAFSGGVFVDSVNTAWAFGGTFSSDTIFQSFGYELSGTYTLSDTAQAFIRSGSKLSLPQVSPAIYIAPSGTKLNIDGITFSTANTEQVADDALEIQDAISAGAITPAPIITENVDGTVDINDFSVNLYNNVSQTGKPKRYDITGWDDQVLTNNSNNYISVDFNSGSPQLRVDTTDPSNESSIILLANVFRDGTTLHAYQLNTIGEGLPNKLNEKSIAIAQFERASGLALGEVATRVATIGSGLIYTGASPINLLAFNSGADAWDFYAHVSSVWTKNPAGVTTQYNNLQYDDGTDLVTLGVNKWTVNWIYRDIDDHAHAIYVLGDAEYGSLALARLATPPSDLPEIASQHSILVGRIIVLKNASSGNVESAFVETFSPSGVTNHNDTANKQGGTTDQFYHLTSSDHSTISTGDFLKLSGRSGGQSVKGGTASGENLDLSSTNHATKGKINIGANSTYDEVNERLGIGTKTPAFIAEFVGDGINGVISTRRVSGASCYVNATADYGNFGTITNHSTRIVSNNNVMIFISASSGNVGIGTGSTAEPNEKLTVEGALSLDEISAPSNTAGYGKVYAKTDKKLYYQDADGNEIPLVEKFIQLRAIEKATDLAIDTNVFGDFRVPQGMIVLGVGAYVDTAGTTGVTTIDINEAGTTILSTKITIDSGEKSSETAATPPVISDSAIAADAILTIDIDGVSTTEPKGLTVWLKVAVKA